MLMLILCDIQTQILPKMSSWLAPPCLHRQNFTCRSILKKHITGFGFSSGTWKPEFHWKCYGGWFVFLSNLNACLNHRLCYIHQGLSLPFFKSRTIKKESFLAGWQLSQVAMWDINAIASLEKKILPMLSGNSTKFIAIFLQTSNMPEKNLLHWFYSVNWKLQKPCIFLTPFWPGEEFYQWFVTFLDEWWILPIKMKVSGNTRVEFFREKRRYFSGIAALPPLTPLTYKQNAVNAFIPTKKRR